jgi:transcriptional regulator with XRE-family HTH domain
MTPSKIQDEIQKRGTQEELAETLDCTPQHLGQVIQKNRVSDRIMRGIATYINRDHREVFPEYYLQPPKRATSKVEKRAA